MINASKEFNQIIYGNGNKRYVGKATILLTDNTLLEIDSSDIWQGGIEITEQTSSSGNFDIGFCSCKQLVLKIKNTNNEFSAYDFYDAEIIPFVGLELSETTEYIKKGVFTVDDPVSQGPYISLTCLDNMHKLDKNVTGLSGSTAGQLVLSIANACGVTLANVNFDGHNRQMTIPEDVAGYTYRQTLSYICQVAGAFAFFNADGNLEVKWYDTGAFEQSDNLDGGTFDNDTPYPTGDNADGGDFTFTETEDYDGGTFKQTDRYHHIYSLKSIDLSTDDVIITGIRVTNDEDTYLYGEEGYVLEVENNPFSVGKEQETATHLGQKIIGMRFRPLNVTAQSNPLIEAGDSAYVSHKGNSYQCFITNSTFTIGQSSQLSCEAESYQGRRVQGLSASTKNIIQSRRVAKKEISTYDLRVKQMTDLITNGFGLFKTEIIDDNGGIIYYMHDQPTIDESEYRWYMTSGGIISQKKVLGEWQTLSGVSKDGNALYNIVTAFNLEVGNEIQMAPDATINWGNIDVPSDLAYTGDIPSDNYITNITKDTVTTAFIKGLNLEVGNEIKMGSNAVITWDNLSEDSKVNLKGEDGSDGIRGPMGPQGPAGSDANVPSYITSTKITQTTIESPTITAGIITGTEINNGDGTFRVDKNGNLFTNRIESSSALSVYIPLPGGPRMAFRFYAMAPDVGSLGTAQIDTDMGSIDFGKAITVYGSDSWREYGSVIHGGLEVFSGDFNVNRNSSFHGSSRFTGNVTFGGNVTFDGTVSGLTPEIITDSGGVAIKFPSGFMICTGRKAYSYNELVVDGVASFEITFPQPFVANPRSVTGGVRVVDSMRAREYTGNIVGFSSTGLTYDIALGDTPRSSGTIEYTAMGFWK